MKFFKYEDDGIFNFLTEFGMNMAGFPYRYSQTSTSKTIRVLGVVFWVTIWAPLLIIGVIIGFIGMVIGIIRDI
jgi:hypothetical protein